MNWYLNLPFEIQPLQYAIHTFTGYRFFWVFHGKQPLLVDDQLLISTEVLFVQNNVSKSIDWKRIEFIIFHNLENSDYRFYIENFIVENRISIKKKKRKYNWLPLSKIHKSISEYFAKSHSRLDKLTSLIPSLFRESLTHIVPHIKSDWFSVILSRIKLQRMTSIYCCI